MLLKKTAPDPRLNYSRDANDIFVPVLNGLFFTDIVLRIA
jgi:hypothetical protein